MALTKMQLWVVGLALVGFVLLSHEACTVDAASPKEPHTVVHTVGEAVNEYKCGCSIHLGCRENVKM